MICSLNEGSERDSPGHVRIHGGGIGKFGLSEGAGSGEVLVSAAPRYSCLVAGIARHPRGGSPKLSRCLPTRCPHFVKLSLDRLANSVVLAFTAGYSTDVGRVNPQLSSDAGEKPSLCYVGTQCHLPRH